MRGALLVLVQGQLGVRIIPADAGSTVGSQPLVVGVPDHPRGCGEHCSCNGLLSRLLGSSPRMRGAQLATQ